MSKAYQKKEPGTKRVNKGRTPADYEALKLECAVLYIKNGLSAQVISDRLNISKPTISKWNTAGRWSELRPDFETLKHYDAAGLFIDKAMSEAQISQQLGISETIIKIWVDLYGWGAAREMTKTRNVFIDSANSFCRYYKSLFPNHSTEIELVQQEYIKKMTPKI
jgi:transposase